MKDVSNDASQDMSSHYNILRVPPNNSSLDPLELKFYQEKEMQLEFIEHMLLHFPKCRCIFGIGGESDF